MEIENKKLVADFLAGDNKAFSQLLDHNLKLVYRFAYRLARNEADAEDIAQETFVKLWKNLAKFDQEMNFRTWLLHIAHNTAIDHLRKKRNFVFSDFDTPTGENSITDTLADPAPLPHELFVRAEEKKMLDDLLGKLTPVAREILTLHHEDGLTFNEISIIVGKSLNTVKSQYRRALLALRKLLEQAA